MQTKTKLLIAILACFLLGEGRAQDFTKVDAHARSISFTTRQDIRALAQTLSEGCKTEKETARAFFVWIANNIEYDVKTYTTKDEIELKERIAQQMPYRVLRSKKAVCEGYSNLFVALCEAVDIQALKVTGITKDDLGKVSPEGHAWCLVRADGDWDLIDPTWGAGEVDDVENKYYKNFEEEHFFTPPETMILDHYPFDPIFQLLPEPMTWAEFQKPAAKTPPGPKLSGTPKSGFARLTDSLDFFVAMDSSQKLYSIGTRVLSIHPTSNYGLYSLGTYYYEKGSAILAAFSQDYNERRKGLAPRPPATWCDQQLVQLEESKALFAKSHRIYIRMKDNDGYSETIKLMRKNAVLQSQNTQIDMNLCKQLCRRR